VALLVSSSIWPSCRLRQIAPEAPEQILLVTVPIFPAPRQVREVELPAAYKFGAVGFSARAALLQVLVEPGPEPWVRQLLQQDRREADCQGGPPLQQRNLSYQIEEWQVRLGSGFIEPRFAVGMGAMVQDVGKMPVQNQAKTAKWCGHTGHVTIRHGAVNSAFRHVRVGDGLRTRIGRERTLEEPPGLLRESAEQPWSTAPPKAGKSVRLLRTTARARAPSAVWLR
jgi:hypothetical protein